MSILLYFKIDTLFLNEREVSLQTNSPPNCKEFISSLFYNDLSIACKICSYTNKIHPLWKIF
jgi:hypothetical protein